MCLCEKENLSGWDMVLFTEYVVVKCSESPVKTAFKNPSRIRYMDVHPSLKCSYRKIRYEKGSPAISDVLTCVACC